MNALENMQVRQLVQRINESLEKTVVECLLNSRNGEHLHHLTEACAKQFEKLKENCGVRDFGVSNSRICTKYEIHDDKNRCFVRLMDPDDLDIQFIWLKGRRKAHKVGRSYLGTIFMEYEYIPPQMAQKVVVRTIFKRDAA